MTRTLTVSRVTVRAGRAAEYLSAVRELAALHEGRGKHLWVFRRAGFPDSFLECSESRSAETHRVCAEAPEDERRLEARLRAVAEYEPGAWDLWEELRSDT